MDSVVGIMFEGSRREFYRNAPELPFAIGDYAVVEAEKDIRYPTEERQAVKLDEFNTEFSSVSAY